MGDCWRLQRGATVLPDGGVRFSVWAPKARSVAVRLVEGACTTDHQLEAHALGVFEGIVPGAAPDDDYRFVLDGDKDYPDPVSRFQPHGVHGPSRVVDPGAFAWSDGAWRGLAMADYIIYELHVGTFTDEGTLDAVIPHLEELRDLGITAVELMPLAEFPGARNWGYDGVHPYAVESAYGGPEALRRLVDAAHGVGLAVIVDVVYNHLGPEGNYLLNFGHYFTDRYRTPWGSAINFDGPDSDEVRRYFIDNALYWVTEFHADGLRLDAIHGIYDFGATHVIQELRDAVHAQAALLGREVVVIGESDLNDPKVVQSREQHGWGLDAQWADDFHHAVHAALTEETNGYYCDFGGVAPIAKALSTPYVFDGAYSAHRRRRHGAPPVGIPPERFVVFIQNHDQVGNRAGGERLAALVSPEQYRLAVALLLAAPYTPMLFMGEEYGETSPFQYFVSHTDDELVEAVRTGRREEFRSFAWGDAVPDPQSRDTFAASRLERSKCAQPEHAAVYALYRDLLRLRRREPAMRPGGAAYHVAHDPVARWVTLERVTSHGEGNGCGDVLAIFNLSGAEVSVPVATTRGGRWEKLLATSDAAFGGVGDAPAGFDDDNGGDARVAVAPWTAILFRRRGGA